MRAQLGMLSDARGLYARLTARENIEYYGDLRGVAAPGASASAVAMLADLLDMGALLDRRTEGFSTGERMKVALARALIHDPQHLILDEPTSGLDVMSTRALRRLARSPARRRASASCCRLTSCRRSSSSPTASSSSRTVAALRDGTADEIRSRAGAQSLEDAFVALAYAPEAADAMRAAWSSSARS